MMGPRRLLSRLERQVPNSVEVTSEFLVASVRSIWFIPALVLLAWVGPSPAKASLIGGVAAQPYLGAQVVGREIILIKKNKKARKRAGWRNKMRKSRVHAQRHAVPQASRRQVVVVAPIDLETVFPLEPPPGFGHDETYSRRALQAPPPPHAYDMPAQPDPVEPEIALDTRSRSAAAGIGCEDAIGIVREFGFSDVEARRCTGATYEFSAVRDGQDYAIDLSSEDGELKRVERQ